MSAKPLLGCIADDFTGATDLANNLVRAGLRTLQTIGTPAGAIDAEAEAIVVALKSRTCEPAEAVARSLEALAWLRAAGAEQIYFKVCSTFDSTPRGNIGPVAEALMDALGAGFAVVCPAFPATGRTVYKGHLFVGDVPLHESGMQNHPLTPMTDPNLVRVMQRQTQRKVGLVSHDSVRRGGRAIAEAFERLESEGTAIAIADAISDDDLQALGAACAGLPLLIAGSGLALGLPQNWRRRGLLPEWRLSDTLPAPAGRCAIVSGSCSRATNEQVIEFMRGGGQAFSVDPRRVAAGDDIVGRALAWARPRLVDGPLLIYATNGPDAVKAVQAELGAERAGALVEDTLAAISRGLIDAGVRQLVIAGGETSGAVVQALGVRQMVIGPQIDPGVPWTHARATACADAPLHLALKSGNFGGPDFFAKAFASLQRGQR